MLLGWQTVVVQAPEGHSEAHVVPVQDIDAHLLLGTRCRCRPVEDSEAVDMWSHRAFDDRESYAAGRKMH